MTKASLPIRPFLLLWFIVATSSTRRVLAEDAVLVSCGSRTFNFRRIIVSNPGDFVAREDRTFGIPEGATVKCSITCGEGPAMGDGLPDANIFFGTLPARHAGRLGGCGTEFETVNDDFFPFTDPADIEILTNEVTVFVNLLAGTERDNVVIQCDCIQPADDSGSGGGDGDGDMRESEDGPGSCFSKSSFVFVENRGPVTMEELQVGDSILVDPKKRTFEPVYSFGHRHPSASDRFVQIHMSKSNITANINTRNDYRGQPSFLEMTKAHMIYIVDHNGKIETKRADKLKVGDELVTADNNQRVVVEKLVEIDNEGLYMPLTPSGKLVVNNVMVSSYVSIEDIAPGIVHHPLLGWWLQGNEGAIMHAWLSPYRILCTGVLSSLLCPKDPPIPDTNHGILRWLLWGKAVLELAEEQGMIIQIFMFGLPLLLAFGVLHAVELVMGFSLSPWFMFSMV